MQGPVGQRCRRSGPSARRTRQAAFQLLLLMTMTVATTSEARPANGALGCGCSGDKILESREFEKPVKKNSQFPKRRPELLGRPIRLRVGNALVLGARDDGDSGAVPSFSRIRSPSEPHETSSLRSNPTLVIDSVAPCLIGPAAGLIIIARGGRVSDVENTQLTCQCARDREGGGLSTAFMELTLQVVIWSRDPATARRR
ncbi:hypothetical protein MTO96_002749 [Rhipicephalus appendiculatus]